MHYEFINQTQAKRIQFPSFAQKKKQYEARIYIFSLSAEFDRSQIHAHSSCWHHTHGDKALFFNALTPQSSHNQWRFS